MAIRQSAGYHINDDDERPQSLFIKEKQPSGANRSGCLVKLLLLLVLLLLAALGYLAYREFWADPEAVRQPAAADLDRRVESLESSLSNLSIRQARLEDSLSRHTDDLVSRVVLLENSLKMAEAALYELGASKADQREVARSIKEVEEKWQAQLESISVALTQSVSRQQTLDGDVQEQMQTLADQVSETRAATQTVVDDFTRAMESITKSLADMGRVRAELTELRADMLIQTESKADKRVLEDALENLEKNTRAQIQKTLKSVEARLSEVQSQIDELKMR